MRIAVFCGSSAGNEKLFQESARKFGEFLAENQIGLVYGGGDLGLMGAVADGALARGGEVYGVIPRALVDKELGHRGLTKLEVVSSMHARKERMAELADAFVALPGGPGTLGEILEQWTWAQIGIHRKPCALLNLENYYDPLIDMANKMVSFGFMRPEFKDMLIISTNPAEIVERIHNYVPPSDKWGH